MKLLYSGCVLLILQTYVKFVANGARVEGPLAVFFMLIFLKLTEHRQATNFYA